jgi:hypothetical protein
MLKGRSLIIIELLQRQGKGFWKRLSDEQTNSL